ncbi:hypothetical protein E0H51_31685 [Rhizobium leguminosarum bv. viciae]|uniref:hypothetical protein n=1 Tax=Rhizobium leguminosarum TaxID=384 RepID=UPI00103C9FC9|nr:hypothetical protein [Rhizobium leguminosarum]TBY68969.1 hypothetical protein E0H51_31685 [Rhizobium leguminosarum bv. viciae]
MPTPKLRPSSIDGIKRLAKRIASEKPVKHTAALDEAARIAGYQTFLHAKRSLSRANEPAPPPNARTSAMNSSDFHTRARSLWVDTINQFASEGDATISWDDIDDIVRVMSPFMGSNKNHAHLPTGGGFDFLSVRKSVEPGCVEFQVFSGSAIIAKPRRMVLERLASDPPQSFLMLELDDLKPAVARNDERAERARSWRQEELIDLGGGHYVERGSVDEEDLQDTARNVVRLFNGQVMLVTKGSIWNGASLTYNGVHDTGTHSEVRKVIQEISDKLAEAN